MTTRYLTTDQNGNGDQTYWDINGYFLHGPSGEKLNLGGGNTTVTASNEIVQIGTSYIRIPQGVSNERPVPGEAGMIRYNTTDIVLEYYNGTSWLPVTSQPPSITSITPQYVQNTISDNSINIIGTNFSINPFVQFISDVSSQVISAQSQTFNSETSITAVISNAMRDLSSLYPFSVKVTNNSGLTSTLANALFWNEVPTFTTAQSPSIYAEIAVGTVTLTGQLDLSAVDPGGHYPLTFTSSDLSGNTSGALTLEPSGAITGNGSSLSVANYNFSAKVTDTNFGFTLGNFTFKVLAETAFTSTLAFTTSYLDTGSTIDQAGTSIVGPVLGGWTIVTFKTTGSGSITFTNISSPLEAKYLVVAGGGGGASLFGAGGAGGFREGKQDISSSSYNVTVGAGGAGGNEPTNNPNAHGSDGSPSLFDSIQSAGGGGGGNQAAGANGGSGGGGGDWAGGAYAGGSGNTPSVSPSQGADGGGVASSGVDAGAGGGGGGGPSGVIGGTGSSAGGGNGGNGTTTTIIPTSLASTLSVGEVDSSNLYFAGGGGGGCWFGGGAVGSAKAGLGGLGGGAAGPQGTKTGTGGVGVSTGTNGTPNTGGGGSGTTRTLFPALGGSGGSGVVILRFPSFNT